MTDYTGLQIDVRCIKCGRLPTADAPLYEMQNHLYICYTCRIAAEQQGKQVILVNAAQMGTQNPTTPLSPTARPPTARPLTSNLPPDSLYAMLGLPLTATYSEIESAINQRMRSLLREPDSPNKTSMIELLHEWQDIIEDPERLENYKNSLISTHQEGAALSVGGRRVYTAQAFLDACEASPEGWADGERYLRRGQLHNWILWHLDDPNMANEARRYQKKTELSDFRALNEMLYCFLPERAFRLYSKDTWQPLHTVPVASSPADLAIQCDIHWDIGERHLYEGAMVYWLEHSQGVQGLNEYYTKAVVGYATRGKDRGIGLELILERAHPPLVRPNVVVDFNNVQSRFAIKKWDREIPYQPIAVTITNTTRGFVGLDLSLDSPSHMTEPNWIVWNNTSSMHVAGKINADLPAKGTITLLNLQTLQRGHTYQRNLNMARYGEFGVPPTVQSFPISIKTMFFFQGLRGILWRYGLRGGIAGFAWNFAAAWVATLLLYWLLPVIIPASWMQIPTDTVTFGASLQEIAAGIVFTFQFLGLHFPLFAGAIIGFAGFCVGIGKGHEDSKERPNAITFRKWAFWLSLAFVIWLLISDQGITAIGQAFQSGSNYYNGSIYILDAFYIGGGGIVVGILIFVIACIISTIRRHLEESLRKKYAELLNPLGRA